MRIFSASMIYCYFIDKNFLLTNDYRTIKYGFKRIFFKKKYSKRSVSDKERGKKEFCNNISIILEP